MKLLSNAFFSVVLMLLCVIAALADAPSAAIAKLLPTKLGEFSQSAAIRAPDSLINAGIVNPVIASYPDPGLLSGEVEYKSEGGKRFLLQLLQFRKDADAYSMLTLFGREMRKQGGLIEIRNGQLGTSHFNFANGIAFFKGATFVCVTEIGPSDNGSNQAFELARLFAERIDKGDGDIPVLIRHLPDWQNAQKQSLFVSGIKSLTSIAPDHPALTALDREADADAVVAQYGSTKLLLIEFNTPQLAGENDRQVLAKLQELRGQNQALPTAYRRVGNYAVFVFDGANEQAANELIDQIKYEQVVQWLGENPYWFKEAQRRYTETTLGVLVAVVKASGLTLVACFGLGGLIGAILFARRRAQQTRAEAFSDAGGMLRLNLDEMTPQTDPARLLTGRN